VSLLVTLLCLGGLSVIGSVVGVSLVLLVAERQSLKRGEGGIK